MSYRGWDLVPGHGPPFLQSGVSPEMSMKEGVLMAQEPTSFS